MNEISPAQIDELYGKIKKDAESSGYYLNPDTGFTKDLVKSLIINKTRYGYQACPCRLASGIKEEDLDIICPCDYRDIDLSQYDTCFCSLYVSQKAVKGKKKINSIVERRPTKETRRKLMENQKKDKNVSDLPLPVWRCKVCGYLCAREEPPEICPICKVPKERFERFI